MSTKRWISVGAVCAAITAALIVSVRLGLFSLHDASHLRAFVASVRARPHARSTFVVLYAVATAAGVPVTPLTLAGGALFGTAQGIALNWLADMMGAALSFFAAKLIAGRRGQPSVLPRRLRRAAGAAAGFWPLLRLRLIPVIPFAILNYGAGLSPMPWIPYLAATGLGLIPTTIVYSMFAANLVGGEQASERHALVIVFATGAIAVGLSLLPTVIRRRAEARG